MKTTEQESLYQDLEKQSVSTLLQQINQEDKKVAEAVDASLTQIEALVTHILPRMQKGGRLFYMGAGTSGRLGVLDASECPPTYGVSHNLVVGIIAGGDTAIRKAVEFAEDSTELGWKDLQEKNITEIDSVIGIAASGTTPYVIAALKACQTANILTGCITCNANSPLTKCADFPVEVVVGPEYVTGSTRMKAGTAQKLVLNMISTSLMIKLGKVQGNKMVDMQLSNDKLVTRGSRMVAEQTDLELKIAQEYLFKYGSVREAVNAYKNGK
jgi:N-acetylmuramic acid 6-phosphate etherase